MSARMEAWAKHFAGCGGCRSRLDGRSLTLCGVGEPLAVAALIAAAEPEPLILRAEMVRNNAIPLHDALETVALEVEALAQRAGMAGDAYQHRRESMRGRTLGTLHKSGMDLRDKLKGSAHVIGEVTGTLAEGDGFIEDATGIMRALGEDV